MATKTPLITSADRIGLTLCFAILVHGILVLGVTFAPEDIPRQRFETMEIILVQQQSLEAAADAKVLAQANLKGGGDLVGENESTAVVSPAPFNQQVPRPTASPAFEASSTAQTAPAIAKVETESLPKDVEAKRLAVESSVAEQPLIAQVEKKVDTVDESQKTADKQTPQQVIDKPEMQETPNLPKTPSALSLMTNSLEVASLIARIERNIQKKESRVRKKFISANTKEHKYAFYMKSWSNTVERIGNLNYPDAARRNKLSGSLRLDVALNQDGSVMEVKVSKSSGHQVLDQAAVRIVKLAAPYAPFPEDIRAETDILHIIRTWRFSVGNQFK